MTINKYEGKTKEEAIEKAKQELGEGAVVLNVKEVKPKGLLGIFKATTYEVTAAAEEKEDFSISQPGKSEAIDLRQMKQYQFQSRWRERRRVRKQSRQRRVRQEEA